MNDGKTFLVAPHVAIAFIQVFRPSVYVLYVAGWRAGLTVNGIPPHG